MRTKNTHAFTLIELLVVVAIISLLVSITLPALGRARRQAKLSVCTSNLHQIGLAMSQYTEENRDWFPSCSLKGDPASTYNMVWEYGGNTGAGWANRPAQHRVLYKYLFPEFFQCPEDTLPNHWESRFESAYEATGTSYPLNGYNHGNFQLYRPKSFGRLGVLYRQTTDVTNLDCVIAGDASMDEYFGDCDPGYMPNPGPEFFWHSPTKAMANLVTMDGAVRFVEMTPSDPRDRMRPRQNWWWENERFSFCPTAKRDRGDMNLWYIPGR